MNKKHLIIFSFLLSIAFNIIACKPTVIKKNVDDTDIEATKQVEIDNSLIKTSTGIDNKSTYNIVNFGKYQQDGSGKTPATNIEWLVLDKTNDGYYLMLSKNIIDCKNFNEKNEDVTFEESTLYEWLNNEFYNTAFNNEEQNYLDNKKPIQLLNIEKAKKYFGEEYKNNINYRISACTTKYAIDKGVEVDTDENSEFYQCGSFFLSDNGKNKKLAAWVGMYGRIYKNGQDVKLNIGDGIRPLIYVKEDAFKSTLQETLDASFDNVTKKYLNIDPKNETYTSPEPDITETLDTVDSNGELIYRNAPTEKYQSNNITSASKGIINLSKWKFGATPIKWIYVKPNTQIISNTKPNGSTNFACKMNASSGSKGCYMTIFEGCDMYGEDYDGRFYCIEDYTKKEPDQLPFSNSFTSLEYNGQKVLDILSKKYNVQKISKGVYYVGENYINIIYCDELDKILAGE